MQLSLYYYYLTPHEIKQWFGYLRYLSCFIYVLLTMALAIFHGRISSSGNCRRFIEKAISSSWLLLHRRHFTLVRSESSRFGPRGLHFCSRSRSCCTYKYNIIIQCHADKIVTLRIVALLANDNYTYSFKYYRIIMYI
jgi:hypothetical protein